MNLAEIANQVLPECDSTNDLARQLAEAGYPAGTWISAERQAGGRGRAGREWISPPGNLYLSMVLRPAATAPLTWIPLATGIVIARFLREEPAASQVVVKWPNDLCVISAGGGLSKLGGILCEAAAGAAGQFVIMGLGLNCEHAPSVPGRATACLGRSAAAVRSRLVPALQVDLPALLALPIRSRIAAYDEVSAIGVGAGIEWQREGARQGARVMGIGEFGELRVVHADGAFESLYAEEVTLHHREPDPN